MRTPRQAVEYATTHLNTGYNGMCLAHVQDSYGAYAVEPLDGAVNSSYLTVSDGQNAIGVSDSLKICEGLLKIRKQ